ncbi:MAG: phosphate signaling complex protein PhoU [Oscillospiraceae bacterium]
MRNKFDQELEKLNDNLLEMGGVIEESIAIAIKGISQPDGGLDRVRGLEQRADELERVITGQCMSIILSQQPVAGDLRVTSTAMKMITDMERIADQAVDIAEISRHLTVLPIFPEPDEISQMAKKTVIMVSGSIDSFVRKDLALARRVVESDDEVDSLYLRMRDVVVNMIARDKRSGAVAIDYIMIAKYLERIADHAVNIAEWVVFQMTGEHKNQRII